MSFLPSNESIRKQLYTEKVRGDKPDWEAYKKGLCPLCGEKLREDARWRFCYRPTIHKIFRAKKPKAKEVDEKDVVKFLAKAHKRKKMHTFPNICNCHKEPHLSWCNLV